MTTNMITAARLIGHKSINGKYQSKMQIDKFPVLGHQMVCLESNTEYINTNYSDTLPLHLHHRLCQ